MLSVRTFLNRQQIQKNLVKHPLLMCPKLDNSTNDMRSPVQLSKCKRVMISNRHLRDLYSDKQIRKKLVTILLEMDREEIFSMCLNLKNSSNNDDGEQLNNSNLKFKDSEILYIPFSNESWKCSLCISWNEIEIIRDWISGVERHMGRMNWNKCEKLMIQQIRFVKGKQNIQLIDSDDDANGNSDFDTKNIDYDYDKTLLGPITLNIHVYSKN